MLYLFLMVKKDKRPFRRYKKKTRFSLMLNGKECSAETIDYSATGIGMIIKDNPVISLTDRIDLSIDSPKIQKSGTIVWLKKTDDGIKAGVNFHGTIRGSLKDHSLSDMLIGFQRSAKTGIIEIRYKEILKKIYIKNGNMIFAGSNLKADWLGDMLLSDGRINKQQYDMSVEIMKKTGKRQGGILVELGYLKAHELAGVVQEQVERIILSLFALKEGELEFKEGPLPTEEVITLKLSAANLIYKGIRRLNYEQCIESFCLNDSDILCFSPDPIDLFQDIKLDEAGKKIFSLIDDKKTAGEIISAAGIKKPEAMKTIYALLSTRIIDIREVTIPPGVTVEEIISGQKIESPQEFVTKAEDLYVKHKRLGYYGILGISENATSDEIKKAYFKTAREYHPDRHFQLTSEMKDKLSEIFAYIVTAYSTLSDPAKRKEYDKTLIHR